MMSNGEPLTTAEVMDYCYPVQRLSFMGGFKSWHRANTIRVLRRVAIPIGRRSGKGAGKGRPLVWAMIFERMEQPTPEKYRHRARSKETIALWKLIKGMK